MIPGGEFSVVEVGATLCYVSWAGAVVKVDVIELTAGGCADGATSVRLVTSDIRFDSGVLFSRMLVIVFGSKLVFDDPGLGKALLVSGATVEDRAVNRFGVSIGRPSSVLSNRPFMNSPEVNILGGTF